MTLALRALRDLTASPTPDAPPTMAAIAPAMAQAEALDDPALAGVADPQGRLKVEIRSHSIAPLREPALSEVAPEMDVRIGFNAADGGRDEALAPPVPCGPCGPGAAPAILGRCRTPGLSGCTACRRWARACSPCRRRRAAMRRHIPRARRAMAFARHPGSFALVIDCHTGAETHRRGPPDGRRCNGHGTLSADGTELCSLEVVAEGSGGGIGLWETAGFARIGERTSGGIGPHDLKRLPTGG